MDLFQAVKARISEPSTWAGLAIEANSVQTFSGELDVWRVAYMLAGVLAMVLPERKDG